MLPQVWTFRFLEIDEDGNARDIPEDERVKIGGAKSTITRSEEMVCMTTTTRDLPPGAYTAWWVLFNDPSGCQNGTGFANFAVRPSGRLHGAWGPPGDLGDRRYRGSRWEGSF